MAALPSAPVDAPHADHRPITMIGPDFPFGYDDYVRHPAGLGTVPDAAHGTEVAIVGAGLSGIVAAYELARMGLKPVVYEADRVGGRLRTERFDGHPDAFAEMGAMRFPPSSTTLFHYIEQAGLTTTPFPNPLTPAAGSTVVDLKGVSHYATTLEELPAVFGDVARAWAAALEEGAAFGEMQAAIRARDVPRIKTLWDPMVAALDDETFYGFLAKSPSFSRFSFREIFGQVGFGTGGWDTDFPNSMLEILRVVYTGADDEHRSIAEGSQALPERLWEQAGGGATRPAAVAMAADGDGVLITDAAGDARRYAAVIFTPQSWLMLTRMRVDEALFAPDAWTAMERTHYMEASKIFVLVDRPFWKDVDEATGRHAMSMTLTDRMPRGTYLIDLGDDRPGVVCLSYTWTDDSMKWLSLSVQERVDVAVDALRSIYPDVDLHERIIAPPVSVSWEHEPWFMGAFKANLPGHYRYQRRLFCHFMEGGPIFLAGDDVSWTAGWAEGAVQTALNAVWGVQRRLGGATHPDNPGPGDRFAELAPVALPED